MVTFLDKQKLQQVANETSIHPQCFPINVQALIIRVYNTSSDTPTASPSRI